MQERRKRVRINYKDRSGEGSDVYSIKQINDIPSDTSSWSREHLTATLQQWGY